MKKIFVLLMITFCFFSCSNSNYKQRAIVYLKTKLPNPESVDTIKFSKPDSVYRSFIDTREYSALRRLSDSLDTMGDTSGVSKINATLASKIKTTTKTIVGWDVQLIYKAKDKKGVVKKDTCRFTFDSNLYDVKDINGVSF